MSKVWGPAPALAIAMENEARAWKASSLRALSVYLYGGGCIVAPYRLPGYKLRERSTYGGKKGRAAIKRLKARGLRPLKESA